MLLLAACGGSDRRSGADAAAVPEAERYGGTAVVAIGADVETLNPIDAETALAQQLHRHALFTPLLRRDEKLELVPVLVERWDTVRLGPDTLRLVFHLRRDVRWHDGVPTTAEDVLFTFDRIMDPRTAYPEISNFVDYSPRAELVDSFTLRFRVRPSANFLGAWTIPAVPKHILQNVPPAELRKHAFGSTRPLGNGPFRHVRHTHGSEWVFEANPEYPESLGGRPRLDRLIFRVIPDQTARLTEVLTGSVHLSGIRAADAARVRAASSVHLLTFTPPGWVYISWNLRLPMFHDARVRRALTMAIDRQQIVDGLLHGHAEIGRSTVTPAHWQFDREDPELLIPYDPPRAKRLLAEAGWQDRNGDGILEDPQGRPFRFVLKTPTGYDEFREIMVVVQAQLREVGVQVITRVVEEGTLVQQLSGHLNGRGRRERDFEALLWAWTEGPHKDDSYHLHSRVFDEPYGSAGFSHPRADWLMDTLKLIVDRDQARPLWREYQRLMVHESPYTVLLYPRIGFAVSERLQGVEMDARGALAGVTEWWIAPRER